MRLRRHRHEPLQPPPPDEPLDFDGSRQVVLTCLGLLAQHARAEGIGGTPEIRSVVQDLSRCLDARETPQE